MKGIFYKIINRKNPINGYVYNMGLNISPDKFSPKFGKR
jgi:hypothetical protein